MWNITHPFTNTAKRKMKEGKRTVGAWCQICSPYTAEIMAREGFDWLAIDLEHAPTDPAILLEVGACPIVLRRPTSVPGLDAVLTHEVPGHGSIVCHKAGIVEPVTLSIFRFLISEGLASEDWLGQAVRQGSLPLLARIDIALRVVSETADHETSAFARRGGRPGAFSTR